jgi:translation initiation factor IF-3
LEVYIKRRGAPRREKGPRINENIRLSEMRLLGEDGTAYGVVSLEEARRLRQETGLDLVEVSPNAKPPVVKLIDYGRVKYDAQKKANEQKKKQAKTLLKEIQFRPNIEAGDLDTKMKRAERFLHQSDKVKMVMQFRGREMAHRDSGFDKFKNIISLVEKLGAIVESPPKMMGNRIITILSPDKKAIKQILKDRVREAKVIAMEEAGENPDADAEDTTQEATQESASE